MDTDATGLFSMQGLAILVPHVQLVTLSCDTGTESQASFHMPGHVQLHVHVVVLSCMILVIPGPMSDSTCQLIHVRVVASLPFHA